MTKDDSIQARKSALKMLRRGVASPSEVANISGFSRQHVNYWLASDPVDWRKARQARLSAQWLRLMRPAKRKPRAAVPE